MKKNFDRLALPPKISYTAEFKNNYSFISTESHQQILPDYKLLVALTQYFSKPSRFSAVVLNQFGL